MSDSKVALLAVGLAALCAGPVLATPIVDGTVGAGEYSHGPLIDAPEPTADFYLSGLDIDKVQSDEDAVGGSRYLALETTVTPFDTNGSSLSFAQMTGVGMYFYTDASAPAPLVYMSLAFDALGFAPDLSFFREWNGAGWTQTTFSNLTDGVDYDVAAAIAMELRISKNAFSVYRGDGAAFPGYLRLQLDDTGFQQDDQIEGALPEPASLAVLAVGGGLCLIRRRRRR